MCINMTIEPLKSLFSFFEKYK